MNPANPWTWGGLAVLPRLSRDPPSLGQVHPTGASGNFSFFLEF